ncbi:MAG TPA: hypothetical protein VI385_02930 [Flavisolibacter sp.]
MEKEIKQEKPLTQEYVKARPEVLPKPTYMPFLFAFSLMLLGWGLLSSWMISVAGVVGMGISIHGWIKDLLNEPGEQD